MVDKVLNLFDKEWSGLHQAAFLLGSFALVSQILALVRDRLFAHSFGASATLDVYYAAFRIPDLVYAAIASLVSVTVLIPFLIKKIEGDGQGAQKFISDVFTSFLFVIALASIVLFFFIPWLSSLLFPGFDSGQQDSLIMLTRILLISPIILGISNLFGSITQTFRRFFVYALSPVLYNVGIIVGILFFYPAWGMAGLGYGVVLGAFLHFAIQFPAVARQKLLPRFSFFIDAVDIGRVAVLSLPRTIGLFANHIALLALVSIASMMSEGSVAVFNLSFNLQSVPLSIIGVSYSVAAFPTLARLFAGNEMEKFMKNIIIAMRHILFWSLPILALFIVLRAQIVRTILGSGEFGWNDTMLTAATLALFAASLVAQALVLLFVRGYYAAGNTMKPLVINLLSSVGIIILAYVLVHLFWSSELFRYFIESLLRVEGLEGTSILMLPLAYSVGMFINVLALLFLFKRDFGKLPASVELTFRHGFYSAVTMGFVAYQCLEIFDDVFNLNTFLGIFLQGLFSGIAGIVVGVLLLKMLGNREVGEITSALHSRFWRARAVAQEKEEL